MTKETAIRIFEQKKVRSVWNDEKQCWYFSVIDVCGILSETDNPRRYWSDLKRKLKKEGINELYEIIVQLKMQSADGKLYKTVLIQKGFYVLSSRYLRQKQNHSKDGLQKLVMSGLKRLKTLKLLRSECERYTGRKVILKAG